MRECSSGSGRFVWLAALRCKLQDEHQQRVAESPGSWACEMLPARPLPQRLREEGARFGCCPSSAIFFHFLYFSVILSPIRRYPHCPIFCNLCSRFGSVPSVQFSGFNISGVKLLWKALNRVNFWNEILFCDYNGHQLVDVLLNVVSLLLS